MSLFEAGHSRNCLRLLRTDEADAIAEDAELHREADIVEGLAAIGLWGIDGKEVGVEVGLQHLAQPDPVHRRRGPQLVVTKAVAGLLQRQLQQIAKIESALIPLALGADMGKDVARPQGGGKEGKAAQQQAGSEAMKGHTAHPGNTRSLECSAGTSRLLKGNSTYQNIWPSRGASSTVTMPAIIITMLETTPSSLPI